jgi:hypothetical protein
VNDLGARFSKCLLRWGAETIGGTSFYLGKVATKISMYGLYLQENKHKKELLNVGNAHEI